MEEADNDPVSPAGTVYDREKTRLEQLPVSLFLMVKLKLADFPAAVLSVVGFTVNVGVLLVHLFGAAQTGLVKKQVVAKASIMTLALSKLLFILTFL
jgi:hypothetical protein